MMSKATRKLVLKKELLRTLDEGHLRAVNGGELASVASVQLGDPALPRNDERLSYGTICTYSRAIYVCELPGPEAV